MRILSITTGLAVIGATHAAAQYSSLAPTDNATVTIHAARLIDGRGNETTNALVTVRGGRIVTVAKAVKSSGATYELGDATLLPGLIDAHITPGLVHQPAGRAPRRAGTAIPPFNRRWPERGISTRR